MCFDVQYQSKYIETEVSERELPGFLDCGLIVRPSCISATGVVVYKIELYSFF